MRLWESLFVREASVRPGDSEARYRLTKPRGSHRVCVSVCKCAHAPGDLGARSLCGYMPQGLFCPGASNWRHQKIRQPVTRQMECLRAAAGGICTISIYGFLAYIGFHPNQPDGETGCGCWY
ncbi:hypothetical protein RLOC_00014796 [Lonchura striata]|uniref:Uncharacterized protein n=1 Tax=Lonchura striata TaxID=40157 RepID=A0A218VB81_9PASE|nr:hypothetical protein RLOC_00014796 [Lonchura striata domestica]